MPVYEKSVFINCPFDAPFESLFHAIVFTVAGLGFIPRCARETEGEADPRMLRIARGLLTSKYSIHDLSRFQGEGAENLARFNMPLELGMALGIRYLGHHQVRVPDLDDALKFVEQMQPKPADRINVCAPGRTTL